MNNVNELRLAAERYSTDLGEFLDDVALLADIDVTDDQANDASTRRVQANLMTIHAAKGMEFDAVFIVGNEQGTFPSQRALIDGQDSVSLAEERRLCYGKLKSKAIYIYIYIYKYSFHLYLLIFVRYQSP